MTRIIILAAGIGSRFGKTEVPKCLLPINSKTVLQILYKYLNKLDLSAVKVRIVIGDQGTVWNMTNKQTIIDLFSDVVINHHNIDYDNSYSLQLGLDGITDEDVVLIDGDILCEFQVLENFLLSVQSDVLLTRPALNSEERGGKVSVRNEKVHLIREQLAMRYYPWEIYSGIAKLSRKSYEKLQLILPDTEKIVDAFNVLKITHPLYVIRAEPFGSNPSYFGWSNLNTKEEYHSAVNRWRLET